MNSFSFSHEIKAMPTQAGPVRATLSPVAWEAFAEPSILNCVDVGSTGFEGFGASAGSCFGIKIRISGLFALGSPFGYPLTVHAVSEPGRRAWNLGRAA